MALLLACLWQASCAQAPAVPDEVIVQAREAYGRKDKAMLAQLREQVPPGSHPLASWVAYWELAPRLEFATTDEIQAFYQRWPGTYVEDRLRNDWLLELGKRRDWSAFAADYPRFRMNDDREVTCYWLITRQMAGQDIRETGAAAYLAQNKADDGCQLLATTMAGNGTLAPAAVWRKMVTSAEAGRIAALRHAATLGGQGIDAVMSDMLASPARFLARKAATLPDALRPAAALAAIRLAASNPEQGAAALEQPWAARLTPAYAADAWSAVARQAAFKQMPEATAWFQRAWAHQRAAGTPAAWSDETLAWQVRAALRSAPTEEQRWLSVMQAIDAMSAAEQADPAWVYWRARALQALAPKGAAGSVQRDQARQLMAQIASPMHFYGKLAMEDSGTVVRLPSAPAPLSAAEKAKPQQHAGLARGMQLIGLGLRSEGVREWNFGLRDFSGDREWLAAAQLACDRQIWDRCINTSERTKTEVDLAQRFPTPLREQVLQAARTAGIEPATAYGIMRQESRFITDSRSVVGASGLMQVMPATARWTAKRIGMTLEPGSLHDPQVNLRLGTAYMKLVLDDFEQSLPMAAAAYNAGPGRARRWREGATMEAAAWAENIPFHETRDYVKKVLSNVTLYAALLADRNDTSLRRLLGAPVGPRPAADPPPDKDLP